MPIFDPRQGDHVFNDVSTALSKPFDTVKAFHSPHVDGQEFLYTNLLFTYSLVRQASVEPALLSARELVATADMERTSRALDPLRSRYPDVAAVNPNLLRNLHALNAKRFGAA